MNMTRPSRQPTLKSAGTEMTSVITRSRSPLSSLTSRSTRRTRITRSTRSIVGGTGSTVSSSGANWSTAEMLTRKKSKRHQPSAK